MAIAGIPPRGDTLDVRSIRAYLEGIKDNQGEINSGVNIGSGGVAVFKEKTGLNLRFRSINSGSSKVTVTQDDVRYEIDIDVDGGLILDGEFSSNGMLTRTSTSAYTSRTITATTDEVSVSNGDGVSGNPTIGIADNAQMPGTEGINVAGGTTAQRPSSPIEGDLRKNTSTNVLEFYDATQWQTLGAGELGRSWMGL